MSGCFWHKLLESCNFPKVEPNSINLTAPQYLTRILNSIHSNQILFILTMTIKNAQETVDNWIKTIGIRYFNELTNTAILMEEVGEVARLMARLYGEQSFKKTDSEATAKEDLADEMADVMFVLICLANQTGVDLTEAMHKNLEKKTKRDKERHAGNEKLK
jgi:NTP pyrophosphatase (non-canonical NTP hydrolase)